MGFDREFVRSPPLCLLPAGSYGYEPSLFPAYVIVYISPHMASEIIDLGRILA